MCKQAFCYIEQCGTKCDGRLYISDGIDNVHIIESAELVKIDVIKK